MYLDRYEYRRDKMLLDYEFYSSGPNGNIRKLISFVPRNEDGITFFSLGFGDYLDEGEIDHLSRSDNKDTEKILATIAAAVIDFTSSFPDMGVYAIGSTVARTRLYQMGVARYWEYIEPLLLVYGFRNDKWEAFRKNANYQAFFVRKKM